MAERGEGTAGGSHSRATTSGAHTAATRNSRNQLVGSVVEGLESFGSPLPLRKRKIGITEVVHTKRRNSDGPQEPAGGFSSITSNTTGATGTTSKRQRISSNSSNSDARYADSGDCADCGLESPASKRQRRSSHVESRSHSAASLAANAPSTPTRNQVAPRRSSRIVEKNKLSNVKAGQFACSKDLKISLKRNCKMTMLSSTSSGKGIETLLASTSSNTGKMSLKGSSLSSEIQNCRFVLKGNLWSCDVSHTIPETNSAIINTKKKIKRPVSSRSIQTRQSNTYSSLNGCSNSHANKKETQRGKSRIDKMSIANDKKSDVGKTGRRNTQGATGQSLQTTSQKIQQNKVAGPSSQTGLIGQISTVHPKERSMKNTNNLKQLPRSVSKQNGYKATQKLQNQSNVQALTSFALKPDSSNNVKPEAKKSRIPISLSMTRLSHTKRSVNREEMVTHSATVRRKVKEEMTTSISGQPSNTEKSPGGGGILKSYPLRNRLRLSDGGGGGGGGSGGNNPLTAGRLEQQGQSQSLPSSPSSQGVAFLADTFRRLRESRRSSQEQSATSKRNTPQTKDSRQSAGTWKRTHGTKKSPLSSKRSSRSKTNNTGSCASSSQHSSRGCGKVSFGSGGSGMSGSHGGHEGSSTSSGPPQASSHGACSTTGTTGGTSSTGVPPATTTASAALHVAPSTSTTSGLLPTASLATLGAIGGGSSSGASGGLAGSIGGLMGAPTDSESEENEMGRLETLLASRGLPPSLFGALGPRMQHILHRSVSSSISSKAQQLLVGLQANGEESEQLQAVIEMCQLLVMGNEDTLAGFPIKQVTPALINLLNMEHNFDMMNHACRALTYMMEALPRSSAVVVDAVPVFLEKLQVIQCMDVAEQSLTALDMLSRKHSKSILQAHGVSACLMYIDFFSTGAQRAALSITANCCQNLTADEFHFIADSLQLLSSRLTTQGDKKCVESVCLAYSRLVDCFQNDPNRLQEIAGHGLLSNIQQLLVMSPPVLNSGTFIMVIRMLSFMCNNCPELAVQLLKNNIAHTLCYLLTNSTEPPGEQVELVSRSPQELYEITCLIGELMPMLPSDGIFAIDGALQRPSSCPQDAALWQWQDATWQNYSTSDSRIIEHSHQSGEDEISLCIQGRAYTIDFHSMQQINDNSGTMRSVQRRMMPVGLGGTVLTATQATDARAKCLCDDSELASNLIRSLFSLLYEVYSSSAGPAVRYKCLRALLRMVQFSSPDLLQQVLKSQSVSSHLATMLSSHDLKIIVGAIQMAEILMIKLPEIFAIYFRREGVMHQIKRLCDPDATLVTPAAKWNSPELSLGSGRVTNPSSTSPLLTGRPFNGNCLDSTPSLPTPPNQDDDKLQSPSQLRLYDVLKRKRTARMRTGTWRKSRQDDSTSSSSSFSEFFMKSLGGRDTWRGMANRTKLVTGNNSSNSTSNSSGGGGSGGSSKSSFLANFNPSRWGRCNSATSTPSHESPAGKDKLVSNNISSSGSSSNNKEVVRVWVRDQAQRLNQQYFTTELQGASHPALSVLNRLIAAIQQLEQEPNSAVQALREISRIVTESDISPFEVIHSGLVRCLLTYLTASENTTLSLTHDGALLTAIGGVSSSSENGGLTAICISTPRDTRLRNFLHVFLGCTLNTLSLGTVDTSHIALFSALITKLNGCVNQLEQFPVKVHDLPGTALSGLGRGGSTSAIKFFNTHQLKCNLQRHPDCTRLRQWRGGPVKVDPLALVQAIERYLVIRGYGRLRDEDDDNSDDDNSDEDIDDTLAAVSVNQSSSSHKLQFVINDHILPYNMTVYQAIRQFSSPSDASASEADTDTETPISHSAIWLQTHTIYYRPLQEEEQSRSSGGRKGKAGGSKTSPKKKADTFVGDGSIVGGNNSVLDQYLTANLPASVTVSDPSIEVLALLRVLHALNRHYGSLYPTACYPSPLPTAEFTNLKLTAKANRQLQDPLVIMTGNVPPWLPQIAYVCPFLFPFETRQLLFYAVSFDRDRALQRLMDSSPELNSVDSSERVTPRLEKRKRTVSRDDILKQAESVISDLASSRAMLEIQYDNEVGTGLGPTLEFYALVSKELQKADLELWRGETVTVEERTEDNPGKAVKYVNASNGLYPLPVPRNMKSAHMTKLRTKFRFLGKFMAKAVMDSRMLDLGLHECVYKWLLSEEWSLGLGDVTALDLTLGHTLDRLHATVLHKRRVTAQAEQEGISGIELQTRLDALTVDGCSVEDLALTFTLPGYPNIEFRKGGSDISVTINNLDQYLQLVIEWLVREGVRRQMEALREGFECVFPLTQLHVFYPEELEQLFCGSSDASQWDMKQLAECCRPDHGYTHNSRAVKFLLQILSEYTSAQQRSFLQFVTGSPRLPVGGFRSLTPALTIVRKTFEAGENPDDFLPSVMTCVNYLKLPDYSSIDIMRAKLEIAAREGQHSFHLS
ncbi:E3 ubiquitin-protein ligase TRIP12 isoform X3 [Procambarus clarkii]|uniref:E3 ubiquitin-protein ligase TRIP12 isoform X3 n=1 Tax=Procambarus clarkii TaxID=6728 RepID=UPI001E67714B|nr:E3 ubiquitin-protein ligase TRIP12-like isoform X3 [Procambarus clarkii]